MPIDQGATNQFKVGLASGQFDFNTDTFKMALYTGAATIGPTTAAYTTTNEVSGTGYSAGGETLTVSTTPTTGSNPSNTTMYLSFSNVTWNPASFTCRGALVYNSSKSNKSIFVLDFGTNKTVTAGTLTIQFPTADVNNAIAVISSVTN